MKEITITNNKLSTNFVSIPNFEEEKQRTRKLIEEAYDNGIRYFKENKLKLATEEFVKLLRPMLSRPIAKSLYVEVEDHKDKVLEVMNYIGQIYLKSPHYLENYAKAAAIFQYCAGFAKKYQIGKSEEFLEQAYQTEDLFLNSISSKGKYNYEESKKQIKEYKKDLEENRNFSKKVIDKLKEYKVEQIKEFTKEIIEIQDFNTKFFVNHDKGQDKKQKSGFVQKLIADCQKQLGPVPDECEYAFVSLGSLSGGRMTPWSDLEFAIIINKDEEKYKEYFRNLTKLMHIKVINLGETALRSVGAEILNNFRTAEQKDDWFWDNIISNGFSFDGPDWHACKLPLGRQGNYKAAKKVKNEKGIEEAVIEEKPNFELILTPRQLAEFQLEPKTVEGHNWFKSDVYLVQALRLISLIEGKQELLDKYREEAREIEKPGIIKDRALQKLNKDVSSFSLKLGNEEEGKLFNIKNDIFRIGDRIIDDLANYYQIMADEGQAGLTVWEMIDKMLEQKLLSQKGAQHLKEAMSIATFLRLATYCHNNGQSESASTYEPAIDHLSEEQKQILKEKTFYIKDTQFLHHFYYVLLPVQDVVEMMSEKEKGDQENEEVALKEDNLFEDSNYNRGMVHARFLKYDEAIKFMEEAKYQDPKNLIILENLFSLYIRIYKTKEALEIATHCFNLDTTILIPQMRLNHDAISCQNLALAYSVTGKYELAVNYFTKALDLENAVEENNGNNYFNIARSYHNLGIVHDYMIECKQAKEYFEKALEQFSDHKNILDNCEIASGIASIYNSLGNEHQTMGQYEQAIDYYNNSLKTRVKVYEDRPNHPEIASSYFNLGYLYWKIGEYEQAIDYSNKSLKIMVKVYENTPNHPDIANIFDVLGIIHSSIGVYEEELKFYELALQIRCKVYENTPNHPDIFSSYSNLGMFYCDIGDYEQASKYLEVALEGQREEYKNSPDNPVLAETYTSLAILYNNRGEYEEALKFYELALQIRYKFFKANLNSVNHPVIADNYNKLGMTYMKLGEYERAIEYYKQAHKIYLKVYKDNPNHPNIASIYDNIGDIYSASKKFNIAISYHRKALQIGMEVYKTNLNNPAISKSYEGLATAYSGNNDYKTAIVFYENALEIERKIYKCNPHNPDIASIYNNLGTTYGKLGEYEQAIECYNQAHKIYLEAYKLNLNHPDIAGSYNNLGLIYYRKGSYELALSNIEQAYEICLISQHFQLTNVKNMRKQTLIQLGNICLLQNNKQKASLYYQQANLAHDKLDFNSIDFIHLLITSVEAAYELNVLEAAINSQLILTIVDSELHYDNHYHNLACFYACKGEIKLAALNFKRALEATQVRANLHIEYAQFAIMNAENLIINSKEITKHLYMAINSSNEDDNFSLRYSMIDKNTICLILQNLIIHKHSLLFVTPQVLAWYLLIKYPQYLKENDSLEKVLEQIKTKSFALLDNISFELLIDACVILDNKTLAQESQQTLRLIEQVDDIISEKIKFKEEINELISIQSNSETVSSTEELKIFVDKINNTAKFNLSIQNIKTAEGLYLKAFKFYQKLLIHLGSATTSEHDELKQAEANLLTVALLNNNQSLCFELNIQETKINLELIRLYGNDVKEVINKYEQLIITTLTDNNETSFFGDTAEDSSEN